MTANVCLFSFMRAFIERLVAQTQEVLVDSKNQCLKVKTKLVNRKTTRRVWKKINLCRGRTSSTNRLKSLIFIKFFSTSSKVSYMCLTLSIFQFLILGFNKRLKFLPNVLVASQLETKLSTKINYRHKASSSNCLAWTLSHMAPVAGEIRGGKPV